MAEHLPDSWIGQGVTVFHGRKTDGKPQKTTGKLVEITDRGVVLRGTKEGSWDEYTFYPMGSIDRIIGGIEPTNYSAPEAVYSR